MKNKLKRRILRNLKRAQETVNLIVENLETEEQEQAETGFAYLYTSTRAAIGDMQIVVDLLKDELREDAAQGGRS
jgi:hypothetical protein